MIVTVDDTNLKAVADAIRAKNGTNETYKPSEMAEAIEAIQAGGAEVKTTTTVRVLGLYDNYNSYCGVYDVGEIKAADGANYNETLELSKTERIYIVASASVSSYEKYAIITLNGEVVHNTTGSYVLSLTDYSDITIVFSELYDGKFCTCAVVAK